MALALRSDVVEPPPNAPPHEDDIFSPLEGLLIEQAKIRELLKNPYSGVASGDPYRVNQERRPLTYALYNLQLTSSDSNERAFIIATMENSFRNELIVCLEQVFKDVPTKIMWDVLRARACALMSKVHSRKVCAGVLQEACKERPPCLNLEEKSKPVLISINQEEQVVSTTS
ncbi:MAG: hypothetical protein K9M03_04185 [Kiritimatiellales bacterium]|nr:hypothetical protein [Kiritimatiellales bacterium]